MYYPGSSHLVQLLNKLIEEVHLSFEAIPSDYIKAISVNIAPDITSRTCQWSCC